MKRYFSIIIAVLFLNISFGQSNLLYNLTNLRQSNWINPARQTNCGFTFGLPILNAINLDINSTNLAYSYIFSQDKNGTYYVDLNKLTSYQDETNYIFSNFRTNLFSMSILFKNRYFFTYESAIINNTTILYPGSFFSLLSQGNYGNPIIINGIGIDNTLYLENSFALSAKILPELKIGARIKFLRGLINFSTKDIYLKLSADTSAQSNYAFTVTGKYDIYTGTNFYWKPILNSQNLPDSIYVPDYGKAMQSAAFDTIKSLLRPNNKGIAFDFGVIYKPIEQVELSASITDLGFIRWKQNPYSIRSDSVNFYFDGIDALRAATDSTYDPGKELADTLMTLFAPNFVRNEYKTTLSAKLYFGATYMPVHWLRLGFYYKGFWYNKKLFSSYNLNLTSNIGYGWGLALDYAINPKRQNNLGLGLVYKLGPLQMYLLTDNLSAYGLPMGYLFAKEVPPQDNKYTTWFKNTQRLHLTFGINFTFGCKDRTDIPLLY